MEKYLFIVTGSRIEKKEIARETEKCYWLKNDNYRYRKDDCYRRAFKTMEEAKDFFKLKAKVRIETLEREIKLSENLLKQYKQALEEIEKQ